MCSVLRCNRPASQLLDYVNDPKAPKFEAPICDEHMLLVEGGAAWRWDDDERCILMGADLDSGGALVLGDWQFVETLGDSELILNCTTPSGEPHEPVRFVLNRDQLKGFLTSFHYLFPDDITPHPRDQPDAHADGDTP